MNRNQLINKIEKTLGFKVVELRYFSQYRNCETPCWDIELDFQGEKYQVEANTITELYENIIEELM